MVKAISAQNRHYSSAFLLHFPKKGRLPLYQVVESLRPAIASAYKLAQANIAAQDSYIESQETYTSLFEDQSKYNAIMSTLADILYHEMRRPGGQQ